MTKENRINILKGAILLELNSKALYMSVEKNTNIAEVKELFSFLAREEVKHVELLKSQMRLLNNNNDFDLESLNESDYEMSQNIISKEVVKKISGAGYEAAVISAALEFEKKAVDFYTKHEAESDSQDQKKLFGWLVKWEKNHLRMLAELDKEFKEQIWYDNNFWPLD